MADSDKNILITPNRGSTTNDPKIEFTGGDNNTVTLTTLDDGTLSFSGSSGQLFSISDSLTGTIFSVNDVSGIPSIEVDDDGTVRLAEFAGNLLVGTDADVGDHKVQIQSDIYNHPLYVESAFGNKIKLKNTDSSNNGNAIDFYASDDKMIGSLRTLWNSTSKYTELYQTFDTNANEVRRLRLKPGDHPKAVYGFTEYSIFSLGNLPTIANVSGLQTALNGKVDDSQVLTNVPSGAVFTDTNTWRPIHDTPVNGATTTSISSNWAFDNVKTAVPTGAVFTDTVYTLPEATATTRGGIEIFSNTDQTVAANAVSATAGRTYGIQLNSAGQAVVNVPWVDTNSNTWRPIHDAPVDGATTTSISSNWAFDNVKTAVPSGAVFTDTVYSHPSSHPATMITTTDEFAYSNSSNVQDVLDDLDQAIANVNAKDPVLTLTGDVTGSATFTNLGNATLTATVANDSHNHYFITSNTPGNAPDNALQYWQASGQGTAYAPTTDWYNTIRGGHGDPNTYYSNTLAMKMTGSYVGTIHTQARSNGNLQGWNQHWHSNNDGPGSGLDADTVDGKHASEFANASHSHPYLPLSGGDMTGRIYMASSASHPGSSAPTALSYGKLTGYGTFYINADTDGSTTEYLYLTAGYGQGAGASNEGLRIGYAANSLTWKGNAVWNAGNDGSGSGLDADLLDGRNSTDFASAAYIDENYYDFTVDGDANTYYPVGISEGGHYGFHTYSISRGYSWTAPSTWNTSTHKGGLTFTFQNCGDGAWGGNDKTIRVLQFHENYTTMVGGIGLSTGGAASSGMIVWLRGGGAKYRFHSPKGSKASVSVYLSSVTASNGSVFAPRSYSSSTVQSEVYARYPVRGNSSLYDGNNKVWHAGNDGPGTGLDADLLDGKHASDFLGVSAKAADSNLLDGIDSGSFLRSDASDSYSGTLTHSSQVALVPNDYGKGVFGLYSDTRYQHVWSMGTAYKTNTNGTSYGNMYGLTWTHTNIGTGTNQSISGLSHQLQLRMNGTLHCAFGSGIWTSGNITAYSDRAVKTNLEVIPNALDKVMQINGYTYDRTDYVEDPETGIMPDTRQAGVVAQEVEAILPEVVSGKEGNKAVAYGNMVALLIEAIKEQQTQIEELSSQLKKLKENN